MRYLVMSETKVKGAQKVNLKLPQPAEQYQDVRVIAFRTPEADTDNVATGAAISSVPEIKNFACWFDGKTDNELMCALAPNRTFTIQIELPQARTVRSLSLFPAKTSFKANAEIQMKDATGHFKTIKTFQFNRTNNKTSVGFIPFAPIVESIPATTSTAFRIVFSQINGNIGFSEIQLSAAPRPERFPEKQLAKLWHNGSPLWDAYLWNEQPEVENKDLIVSPANVLDVSAFMQADGSFTWTAPAGEWVIQRIGMTSTGQQNVPASVEATGLEVDKMNRKWVAEHFEAYIGKIIRRLPVNDRSALKYVVADSYETGGQNWTDDMAADFKQQYGYDPIPYLPVIFGRVVGSVDLSDRFLWDLRRLIADRISYQYVGGLRDKTNEYGLKLWLENYGHWGYPGEFLQYGGQSDEIGGEFWTGDEPEGLELRAASSAAHGYGKNVVHAEAFTSGGPMWNWEPWSLKKRGDWAATKGINHFVMHVYIHQPYEDKVPGINAWFGVEFNRHNTWFYQSKEWMDYMRRTHYMLQQGKYVADVAYFIGEDAPKMTGVRNPQLPDGYNFDYVNAEVIEKMQVQNNRLVLPDGMSYSLLVLPPLKTMRPAVLSKLSQLINDGGIVVGQAPEKSPGLQNYPACDEQVKQMAHMLWQNCDGIECKSIAVGKGKIYNGVELTAIFNELNLVPDIGNIDAKSFPWIHRSAPDAEIYYISNQKDQPAEFSPAFRVSGLQPELWNPVTKEIRDLPDFRTENGKTTVPLEFAPRQSYFIVFRKKATTAITNPINFIRKKTIGEVSGAWTVSFDKKQGAPESVVFEKLEDWTKRPESGIKYYSGTARYRKVFNAPKFNAKKAVYLNLGAFNSLAEVKLNGHALGVVWAEPRLVEISKFLKKKNNVLEIEITNTWNNRLVGDANLPADKRLTNATTAPEANAPLLPSGLIGPVTLQIDDPKPYVQKISINVDKPVISKPDKALVTLSTLSANATIHYTTDDTTPTEKSAVYSKPFELTDYSVIKAKAFEKGKQPSDVAQLEVEAYDPKINGLNHEYFEGEWSNTSDFENLMPLKKGKSTGFDLAAIKEREDHYGVKFRGTFSIETEGSYTFYLLSDDGSKLYIDGKLIIDNDGSHGEIEKTGSIELTKGKHSIRVDYFDNINGEALKLMYSIGNNKKEIPIRLMSFEQ